MTWFARLREAGEQAVRYAPTPWSTHHHAGAEESRVLTVDGYDLAYTDGRRLLGQQERAEWIALAANVWEELVAVAVQAETFIAELDAGDVADTDALLVALASLRDKADG